MKKRKQDYDGVCRKIKAWHTRLKRAANMIVKLEKQKLRLEKRGLSVPLASSPEVKPSSSSKPEIGWVFPVQATPTPPPASPEVAEPTRVDDGLDIPSFLKADAEARAEILAQQQEAKKKKAELAAERRKLKAEQKEAELTGKTRKMPLSGRDALKSLR